MINVQENLIGFFFAFYFIKKKQKLVIVLLFFSRYLIVFNFFLIINNYIMSDEVPVEEAAPFISTLDLFLLSAVLGFTFYWIFYRKDEKPRDEEFKQMTVV